MVPRMYLYNNKAINQHSIQAQYGMHQLNIYEQMIMILQQLNRKNCKMRWISNMPQPMRIIFHYYQLNALHRLDLHVRHHHRARVHCLDLSRRAHDLILFTTAARRDISAVLTRERETVRPVESRGALRLLERNQRIARQGARFAVADISIQSTVPCDGKCVPAVIRQPIRNSTSKNHGQQHSVIGHWTLLTN